MLLKQKNIRDQRCIVIFMLTRSLLFSKVERLNDVNWRFILSIYFRLVTV